VEGGHLICMVALNGDQLHNSSSRYPTIGRLEASDAHTPSGGLVRNLNLDLNAVWVHAIMETIQRMVPDGSPLAVLAQQGAKVANLIVAEKSPTFPGGNLSSVTMIGQGVPDGKLHHRQVQVTVYPSMMHGGASVRTMPRRNTVMNGMTSATLLKIGGVSGLEHHPDHDGL
jgi:hypothetical protein